MRVLLIKTSSLGDVIHTLPALTDAARALPGIQFDWVVEEGFAEIPRWHPAVANVFPVALRRWRKNLFKTWRNGEWQRFKDSLSQQPYDLILDAQGLLKSAFLTRYARGPVVGLDAHSAREPFASRFYQRGISVAWGQHAVERVRQLFAQALGYALPATTGDYGLNRARLGAAVADAPYVLFLHGTTWATKHWPEPYWRELAERLSTDGWLVRLPWGNAEEKARAERIAQALPTVQVLPKLNLAAVAAQLAGATACVAVDTGLGHLAAALDVPTLSLYGPTNAGWTGAYGRGQVHVASDFACAPCLKKTCRYTPSADERQQFNLLTEQPLCFTRVNPARVAAELAAQLPTRIA